MSVTHFAELQGLLQPWQLSRLAGTTAPGGAGVGSACTEGFGAASSAFCVAGQLMPGPLEPGKLSVLQPDFCASHLYLSLRFWQLVGVGLSVGTKLPRWGSSLSPNGQGGPCVSAAATLSAGRVHCLLASAQQPCSQLLDRMDWPRLLLVSLWREETTLVRGCLRAALALLHKRVCAPGKFRCTDAEVGPSRPPGIVWVGRLGLEGAWEGGLCPGPLRLSCRPWACAPGVSRPLAGAWGAPPAWQPPCPSGGPPGPWRALLSGLPQQTA